MRPRIALDTTAALRRGYSITRNIGHRREVHTSNDVHLHIEDAAKWLVSHLGICG
jgi:hypothetical protein